jgi:murein DD-endopeptidase MepM/ murein hydrolase activator NlpD
VLTIARDPRGNVWVGTYGRGIYRLRPGTRTWEPFRHDSTLATTISWDYVQAIGFGLRGEVWYGTIGNGWGLSTDDGRTWKNWSLAELGRRWLYVAPSGIVARGDTVFIGTADGVVYTSDQGQHWVALSDSAGAAAPTPPADSAIGILSSRYVRRLGLGRRGLLVTTLKGNQSLQLDPDGWSSQGLPLASFQPLSSLLVGGVLIRGTICGLRLASDTLPCYNRPAPLAEAPKDPLTIWFRRPIDRSDNAAIDQTYRYGSTMGGNFQQHQGVEFNNPEGTPVRAIGGGTVVYAGPAEQGALTVAIRHDSLVTTPNGRLRLFSVYYHNSALAVRLRQRVAAGQLIARVGHTGRATNDHLHLEIHAAPGDSVPAIVDSLQRFPPYTTNPELWIEPLPGTGIVAGQVFDGKGAPVPQARIYGLLKNEPMETPFVYAETYGDQAHPHPLYGEHFAVSDVLPGSYLLGTSIGGKSVFRQVTVEAGKLTWVVFRP